VKLSASQAGLCPKELFGKTKTLAFERNGSLKGALK
jgi:hypothetical protein